MMGNAEDAQDVPETDGLPEERTVALDERMRTAARTMVQAAFRSVVRRRAEEAALVASQTNADD